MTKRLVIVLASVISILIISGIIVVVTSPAEQPTKIQPVPAETAHEHEERPEMGIGLVFTPGPVLVGDEVKFSIWVETEADRDTRDGTVIIGFEKGTVPMSTMTMMGGMVKALEESPGNYTSTIVFPEAGDYIVHTHFIPHGDSMMTMMKHHADFGPLRVYRIPPDISALEKVDIIISDRAYDPGQHEDFSPRTLTVKAGTTVGWRNGDKSAHTITEHKYRFTSPLLNPGETWSYTFNEPGVYEYHCNPHLWMVGTIIVVA